MPLQLNDKVPRRRVEHLPSGTQSGVPRHQRGDEMEGQQRAAEDHNAFSKDGYQPLGVDVKGVMLVNHRRHPGM